MRLNRLLEKLTEWNWRAQMEANGIANSGRSRPEFEDHPIGSLWRNIRLLPPFNSSKLKLLDQAILQEKCKEERKSIKF